MPRRCRFEPWVRKILWRRKRQPILVFLPEKNLMDRGAWWATVLGVAELGMVEHVCAHTHTQCIWRPWKQWEGMLTVWGRDDLESQATTSARTRCP